MRRILALALLLPSLCMARTGTLASRKMFCKPMYASGPLYRDLTFAAPLTNGLGALGAGPSTVATYTGGVVTGAGAIHYIDGPSGLLVPRTSGSPALTPNGLLVEGAISNLALQASDLTKAAAYTATNCTTTFTATGPDGVANDATTITATAGNATVTQAITSAAGVRITSVWIKRRTGTGEIDLSNWGATTWEPVTVTSAWTRVSTAASSAGAANPTIGIRIVTNADAVDVFGLTHWVGAFAYPSTLVTQAVAASVSADVVTYAGAGNVNASRGTVAAVMGLTGNTLDGRGVDVGAGGAGRIGWIAAGSTVRIYDGTSNATGGTVSANESFTFAGYWGGSAMGISKNHATAVTASFDGSMVGDLICIGINSSGAAGGLYGTMRSVVILAVDAVGDYKRLP